MNSVIELETKTASVVVYPDRAQVTRSGATRLEAGVYRLVANGLPAALVPASLRARGRGTARARLLSVDSERVFFAQAQDERIAKLEGELEALTDQDRELADQEKTAGLVGGFLGTLADSAGKDLGRGLAFSRTSLTDVQSFAAYLESSSVGNSAQLREVQLRRREVGREIERVRRELEHLRSPQPLERTRAAVGVEVTEAGELEVEMSYVVPGASWTPLYDIRVTEGNSEVEIAYLGQVSQNTGEDWMEVALSLSTAKPAVTATLPEVRPWYIQPIMPRAEMASLGAGMPKAMMASAARQMDAAPMPAPAEDYVAREMEAATATAARSGAALTFVIGQRASLPSDGSPHKTTIGILSLPSKPDYVTFPKLAAYAYRRAKVTNNTELMLLAGQASVYWGGDYVGATRIPDIASGQALEVFLGTDERIAVKRELSVREVDKNLLGNRRRLQYGYRMRLQNLLTSMADLEVLDQLPVPRHEDIKVQLVRASIPPTEQEELGALKWRLALAAGEEQTIEFVFAVDYPRDMQIAGLPD